MKRLLFFMALMPYLSAAQGDYFQQSVDYQIEARLDDEAHELHGYLRMAYHNNAPRQLDTLYLHLWPNAYRNRQTAYARQALRLGNTDFQFAPPSQRGGIDSLDFRLNGREVDWAHHPKHIDIAILKLESPIPSGDSIVLATPFRLAVPYCFSRLGRDGQSYQFTQWYPKPAVYDEEGWHPMPYLDMGEFYAEFGSFDVRISLPANYRVAATGRLQTASEREFLRELAAREKTGEEPDTIPSSASQMKTLRYTAEGVHDFAWFADKRFLVDRDTLRLPSGRVAEAWAFYRPGEWELWQKAAHYVKRALRFYSNKLGEYPYPQATAVQMALGTGGGMEYPMVTNISGGSDARSLDEVITHEVGHNWFYGILASNERDHAWMDEGLNSYYEQRYMRQYYGSAEPFLPKFLMVDTSMTTGRTAYLYQARRRLDQPPQTPSDEFSPINYYLGAYEKPAQALWHLQAYLGEARFDQAMQAYYRAWRFRHPQPEDFRAVLESSSGERLAWLFDGMLFSERKMDYSISKVKKRGSRLAVTLRNRGGIDSPVPLAAFSGETMDSLQWVPGFFGKKTIRINGQGITRLQLDPAKTTLDLYRSNDRYAFNAWLPKLRWPELRLLGGVQGNGQSAIFAAPALGWNNYDKTTLGLLLYNHLLPEQRLEFVVAPMVGTATGTLSGWGSLHANLYPGQGNFIYRMRLGLKGRRFSYRRVARFGKTLVYNRLQPYLRFDFASSHRKRLRQSLLLRALWVEEATLNFGDNPLEPSVGQQDYFLQEARFTYENERVLSPYSWTVALEHQAFEDIFGEDARYVKASAEWRGTFNYTEEQAVHLRLFGGYFLFNSLRESNNIGRAAFNLISQGYNDYRYDDFYLGRTDNEGIWSRQISTRGGAFKSVIGQEFNLGRSNNFILAANFRADLPPDALFGIPLKPYLDLGYFDDARPISGRPTFDEQFLWSGGLMLSWLDEAVAIYFPLVNAGQLEDRLAERGNYWQRIAFQINLSRFNPWEAEDRLRF
jgi:hypothetical protein